MLFNKTTGKLCGIIDIDPLDDVELYCLSFQPGHTSFALLNRWNFCTRWSEIFETCHVVCPD